MKHLYTDGIDTVSADSIEDADNVFEYAIGDPHDANTPWELVPDDKLFSINFDDELEADYVPTGAQMMVWDFYEVVYRARADAWANCEHWQDTILCSTES
jgi:hypothetical protein